MKNKVDKKRELKKLEFKTMKISNVKQSKLIGGGWEDWVSYAICSS